MNMLELIRTRKSIRTFDGRPLLAEDRKALEDYVKTVTNPYGVPISFVFLDAEEHGLSSPVLAGEHLYVAGKVHKVPHCGEAFGYSFEKLVLFAWSRGIGTTWIAGTMDRPLFEKAAAPGEDEMMPIVSPLGYPSEEKAEADTSLRAKVHADERRDPAEIFFDRNFSTPLSTDAYEPVLDAIRWSPSAVNMQPWRVVKDGNAYHFFERHRDNYKKGAPLEIQKIDMGIAICNFMAAAGGTFSIADPGIERAENIEYIATVTV